MRGLLPQTRRHRKGARSTGSRTRRPRSPAGSSSHAKIQLLFLRFREAFHRLFPRLWRVYRQSRLRKAANKFQYIWPLMLMVRLKRPQQWKMSSRSLKDSARTWPPISERANCWRAASRFMRRSDPALGECRTRKRLELL